MRRLPKILFRRNGLGKMSAMIEDIQTVFCHAVIIWKCFRQNDRIFQSRRKKGLYIKYPIKKDGGALCLRF